MHTFQHWLVESRLYGMSKQHCTFLTASRVKPQDHTCSAVSPNLATFKLVIRSISPIFILLPTICAEQS